MRSRQDGVHGHGNRKEDQGPQETSPHRLYHLQQRKAHIPDTIFNGLVSQKEYKRADSLSHFLIEPPLYYLFFSEALIIPARNRNIAPDGVDDQRGVREKRVVEQISGQGDGRLFLDGPLEVSRPVFFIITGRRQKFDERRRP